MARIPEGLRRWLEKEAARNARSMNAELVHRLEQSREQEAVVGGPHTAALLRVLSGELQFFEAEHGERWIDTADHQADVATLVAGALVKKLPGLHSITIRMLDDRNGKGLRSIMYASEEIARQAQPALFENATEVEIKEGTIRNDELKARLSRQKKAAENE